MSHAASMLRRTTITKPLELKCFPVSRILQRIVKMLRRIYGRRYKTVVEKTEVLVLVLHLPA